MRIMNFKDWLRIFDLRESLKDSELNKILDKISDGLSLSSVEKEFLNKYDSLSDDDLKDFTHLSKDVTYQKIRSLLDRNKKISCDLYDKNGKIGLYIVSIENQYNKGICIITLKGGETTTLTDNFLYNLIYNVKKNEYSLQSQDEYFEEIPVENDND